MNTNDDVEILPEDQVQLTTDQKNLITLALEKQLPFEDAEFLERVQKKADTDSYAKINTYFTEKYGSEFGLIYLAAITSGEESCKEAIRSIENLRAKKRLGKSN